MKRTMSFASRNIKEILRDPLAYIFCLGFPLVMLVVMTLVNESIPPEANMTLFNINQLTGGMAVFGLTFVMLFTCLNISKDRSGSFLVRLYATPMKGADFILGYTLPMLALAFAQIIITFAAGFVISLITGQSLNVGGMLLAAAALIPSAVMFICFGLLFGTLFSEKAAPGLCSVLISLASFLGGIWFDADGTGGILLTICRALPFYHSVKTAHLLFAMETEGLGVHMLITLAYTAVVAVASVLVFRSKMRADLA